MSCAVLVVDKITRHIGRFGIRGVQITLIGVVTIDIERAVDISLTAVFCRARDLHIVPNRGARVGVRGAFFNREDVALFVTGVRGRTAVGNGHIIVIGLAFGFVRQITCHICSGRTGRVNFTLVGVITIDVERTIDVILTGIRGAAFHSHVVPNGSTTILVRCALGNR